MWDWAAPAAAPAASPAPLSPDGAGSGAAAAAGGLWDWASPSTSAATAKTAPVARPAPAKPECASNGQQAATHLPRLGKAIYLDVVADDADQAHGGADEHIQQLYAAYLHELAHNGTSTDAAAELASLPASLQAVSLGDVRGPVARADDDDEDDDSADDENVEIRKAALDGSAARSRDAQLASGAADRQYARYMAKLRASGRHVLRYQWGGQPLLPYGPPLAWQNASFERAAPGGGPPPCSACGSHREFEFQVTSAALAELGVADHAASSEGEAGEDAGQYAWSTVVVYACAAACAAGVQEWAAILPE